MGDVDAAAFMVLWVFLLGLFSTLALSETTLAGAALMGVATLAAIALIAGALRRIPKTPIPPDEAGTVRDRVGMRLGFLKEAECGCVWYDADFSYKSNKPTHHSIEDDEESFLWVKSRKGARVTYQLHRERMKRCENCGKHCFHQEEVDYSPLSDLTEIKATTWEDEPIPDKVAESGYEVMDESIVEVA